MNASGELKRRQVQVLFNLPKLSNESATELRSLLEGFERTVQTLDQLVQFSDYKYLLLLNILCTRLDPVTRRIWGEYSSTKEQDTIKDLAEFPQRRSRALESLHVNSPNARQSSFSPIQSTSKRCVVFFKDHFLYQCPTVQQIAITDRDKVLRMQGLCRNCFKRGHRAME